MPRGEKSSSRSTRFLLSIYPRDICSAYPRSDRGYVADQDQPSAFSEDCTRKTRDWSKNKKKKKKKREKKLKKKTEIPADSNWVKARATFEFHTEFVVYPVSRNEFWNEKHEGERLRYTRVYGRQIKGNKTVKLDSLLSLMEFARDKISWEYQFFEFLSTYM